MNVRCLGIGLVLFVAGCGSPEQAPPEPPVTDAQVEAPSAPVAEAPEPADDDVASDEEAVASEPEASAPPAPAAQAPEPSAPAVVETAAPAAPASPPAAFAACRSCHTVDQGGPHRIGPNLFGVAGGPAGAQAGFNYSDAMSEAGFTWTEDRLDAFLLAPREAVPGTRMMSAPVRDAEARREIIAYLSGLR